LNHGGQVNVYRSRCSLTFESDARVWMLVAGFLMLGVWMLVAGFLMLDGTGLSSI